MESNTDGEIVSVTSKGQATVPKRFREKLGVETPGLVRFRETDAGAVVVEAVPGLDSYRGSLAVDEPAAELVDDARPGRGAPETRRGGRE